MNDEFGVPVELNRRVFSAQNDLRGALHDSLRAGAAYGALLAEAKRACRHGEFLKWLDTHFEGSERHAQRLMQLAKKYPDPEKIPMLSLHKAIRLLAGGEAQERTVRAQDRLSGETCTAVMATLPKVLKLIEIDAIGPLKLEGVTAQHPAMKAAKKLVADVRRLRGLVESLGPREHVSDKRQEDAGRATRSANDAVSVSF